MKSENVLFVGGPWDGQWRSIPDGNTYYHVMVHTELSIRDYTACREIPQRNETKTVTYEREHLYDKQGNGFVIFFYSSNGRGLYQSLLDGYRKPTTLSLTY